mgnify:CR=1 FL=1
MDLSLIIPSKNIDNFLILGVKSFISNNTNKVELIIVTDSLEPKHNYIKLCELQKNNTDISILLNKKKGRVEALNYGFQKSVGKIIKCIDSDDILLPNFFKNVEEMKKYDAHCHNAIIANNDLEKIISYTFNPSILNKEYSYITGNMISSPRWTWSFSRKIGNLIFPIPANLFAEDFWFTFIIKKNSNKILYMNEELYIYRQHENNEWGGVANFSRDVMIQRSKWLLNEITQLKENSIKLNINKDGFQHATIYHNSMLNGDSFLKIISLPINLIFKLKMIIILYFPKLASFVIKIKWFIDKYRFLREKK